MSASLLNLIWDLRELAFEGFSRGWDGLDRRDKHAEIDQVIGVIKQIVSDEVNEIASLLIPSSPDERRVLAIIARRFMGKGRENYGALRLATDRRDFAKEMSEEAIDALVYWAAESIQRCNAPAPDDLICGDCGESGAFVAQHKPDCPWRVIVPGKGE